MTVVVNECHLNLSRWWICRQRAALSKLGRGAKRHNHGQAARARYTALTDSCDGTVVATTVAVVIVLSEVARAS
jgi:hypothetical protein